MRRSILSCSSGDGTSVRIALRFWTFILVRVIPCIRKAISARACRPFRKYIMKALRQTVGSHLTRKQSALLIAGGITSARKLLTNRSYGVSYHLCSG